MKENFREEVVDVLCNLRGEGKNSCLLSLVRLPKMDYRVQQLATEAARYHPRDSYFGENFMPRSSASLIK